MPLLIARTPPRQDQPSAAPPHGDKPADRAPAPSPNTQRWASRYATHQRIRSGLGPLAALASSGSLLNDVSPRADLLLLVKTILASGGDDDVAGSDEAGLISGEDAVDVCVSGADDAAEVSTPSIAPSDSTGDAGVDATALLTIPEVTTGDADGAVTPQPSSARGGETTPMTEKAGGAGEAIALALQIAHSLPPASERVGEVITAPPLLIETSSTGGDPPAVATPQCAAEAADDDAPPTISAKAAAAAARAERAAAAAAAAAAATTATPPARHIRRVDVTLTRLGGLIAQLSPSNGRVNADAPADAATVDAAPDHAAPSDGVQAVTDDEACSSGDATLFRPSGGGGGGHAAPPPAGAPARGARASNYMPPAPPPTLASLGDDMILHVLSFVAELEDLLAFCTTHRGAAALLRAPSRLEAWPRARGGLLTVAGVLAYESALTTTALRSLDLERHWVGAAGAGVIADALRGEATQLSTLRLSAAHIGDGGAAAISGALKVNRAVTALNLSSNGIGPAGGAAIADMLRANSTLVELNLRWNQLGDGGAVSLAGALGENSRLASLRLSWNKMGDGGAGALGAALGRTNRTLTALDISRKDVSPAAAAALAKAVEANAALSAGLELYGSRHRDEFVVVSGAASPASSAPAPAAAMQ